MPIRTEIVPLNPEHLDHLALPEGLDRRAYFSPGSSGLCLLEEGKPVFAGGIVNLQWRRGEAWILPTPFFHSHLRLCLRALGEHLPRIASSHGLVRVQATCVGMVSGRLFRALGFEYEGNLRMFGPNGETCQMWSRIFP